SARTPEEVKLLGAILEKGVDGCLLVPSEQYSVEVLINSIVKKNKVFDLEELSISSIKKIGLGDRVCVDTCSILHSGEGLLVGSTAAVFILIEAEVLETGFVNARPFRVNAGVVASYVLVEDKTQYLSEFKAGSDVMIVDRNGNTRPETVARIKIERRPLVLIQLKYNDRDYPIILQDAETVRLISPTGSIPVTEVKPGDTVLGKSSKAARHFGMEVEEFLEER
ncbi:MAG: 3-dehydroquinate synthase II, partial [Candidatus Kariarchaeaceae archaeon]